MSRTAPRLLPAVLAALLCAGVLGACGDAEHEGTVVPPPLRVATTASIGSPTTTAKPSSTASSSTASPDPASPDPAPAGLAVTSFARDGSLLSVIVRNRGPREIVYARVRVTVRDRSGRVLLSTVGRRLSKATTIVGLPPDHQFGLVLTLPPSAPAVGSVRVAAVYRRLAPWHEGPPPLRAGHARLTTEDGDAVVMARFAATGPVTPYVSAQAFLVDPRNRLVAVVSGRFYCFDDTTSRTLRMQLLHPVPTGTRVATVLGYPIPSRAPIPVPKACR